MTFKHKPGCMWLGRRCPNEVHDHGCEPEEGCDWCRCACRPPKPPEHKRGCRARATDQYGITWAIVEKDCDCGVTAPEKLKT